MIADRPGNLEGKTGTGIDVHDLACRFAATHAVAYHRGAWWIHAENHYVNVQPDYVDGRVRLWMVEQGLSPKAAFVNNLVAQVRAVRHVSPCKEMPSWLGESVVDPKDMIAFRNGLLDAGRWLRDGDATLAPHTPGWFSASCLPFDLDPSATCPTWLRCLREWLVDDDQIGLLQTWMGYCMVPDNSLQKFLMMVGPPRSGKSTTLNVMTNLLGKRNVAAATFQSLSGDFGLQEVVGKLAMIISEIHADRSNKGVVQMLKNLTGGDACPVNRKGIAPVSMILPARVTVATNQMPRLPDDSGALHARTLLLKFPNSFLGREDIRLGDALEAESAGIANWALAGLRRLRAEGRFVQAERGKALLADLQFMSSPVEQFLQDVCDVGPGHEQDKDDLYHAWVLHCHGEGHEPGAKSTFGARLKAARPEIEDRQKGSARNGGRTRVYVGIRLKPEYLQERTKALRVVFPR